LSRDISRSTGTLIEAWASMKSFCPKDGAEEPPTGAIRSWENCSGLVVAADLTPKRS
jgi:hypothetical protein